MYTSELLPELEYRWSRMQDIMREENAKALLITDNVNLFYMSGRVFNGYIYIEQTGKPCFFVRRPVDLTGDNLFYIRKIEDIPGILKENEIQLPDQIYAELDIMSYSEAIRNAKAFGISEFRNGSSIIRKARSIKSLYEIEKIRESANLHALSYSKIPSLFERGMTDIDLSIKLEQVMRKYGSLGLFRISGSSMEIFMGSILVGDNADNPSPYDFATGGAGINSSIPIGANGTVIKEGHSIIVDMGGNFNGYMTDMTRVFSLGKLSDLAYKAHEVSLAIEREVENNAKEGVAAADLYNLAAKIAKDNGLEKYFMGHKQQAGFVGHGLGIEINEQPVLAPRSKDILKAGMIVALEPKFVIPGTGGVGVENTFVVTKDGFEKLTISPEEIIELV